MKRESRQDYRRLRHQRARQKLRGTAQRPRMSIMISNRHIYVQFIDDDRALTLAAASTVESGGKINVAVARSLGVKAAAAAREKGIDAVVLDRGGFKFHGRVKAIADAAREAGLKF